MTARVQLAHLTRALLALAAIVATALPTGSFANPSGKKWFTNGSVPYRVYNHSSINCPGCSYTNGVLPAVQNGFARWNSGNVNCTKWSTTYQGTFTLTGGPQASAVGNDQQNRVLWLGGAQWQHGAQTLGLTTTIFYTSTGEIIDADMELNNDVTWKLGGTAGNQVDVESIVTHEAGHFLGLDHSTPTAAVMYAYYNSQAGEIKRNLTTTDINDVCTVYPGGQTLGSQGDPCTASNQCGTAAPACRGALGGAAMICTKECTSNSNCPTGYTCQTSSPGGTTGKACLPPVGSPDLCKFCTSGTQCSTGQCVTNGPQNWCTRTCMTAADCGTGYQCVQGTTSMVCVPSNNTCPTPQCTSNAQCAVGYACTGGMCTATGNPGDRCEVSIYCDQCSVCVGSSTEAYCRTCCGGGGQCQGCPAAACATGFQCTGLQGSTEQVCYPFAGVQACGACDAQTPCQSGYSCVFGRCHSPCNPASPGSCGACYDQGGGNGICACPGEAVGTGSACGQLANGLKVCTTGNACVGNPKTCRAKCDPNVSTSCPSGQACQTVDGQAVCIPQNQPGQRCSTCQNGNVCAPGFICVNNRCYEPCNVALPTCLTCVEAAPNVGICACDDQIASAGQGCGLDGTEVYACDQGLTCVGGVCRVDCDPSFPTCNAGETCVGPTGNAQCIPAATQTDAGTSNPPPPPPPFDAGVKPGGNSNFGGCGCEATATGAALWAAVVLFGAATRRRRTRR